MQSSDLSTPVEHPLVERTISYIHWGPIIAGALTAAGLAAVLQAFGTGVGLAASSAAPTWRDASMALVLLSGLYIVLVALAAYSLGGYITGRMRAGLTAGTPDEIEMRDGVHGLVMWGITTLVTGLLLLMALQGLSRAAAPSQSSAGPGASSTSEAIIAYDLDRLFRGYRESSVGLDYARAEAGRILLTASSHRGMLPEDRTYLVRMVSARTGLSAADAERRVDDVIARAKDNIGRARRAAVLLAFMAGAAALLGAVAAWFAACAGGRHRDGAVLPAWMRTGWSLHDSPTRPRTL